VVAAGRAAEVSRRRVAPHLRHYSAARPESGRTPERRKKRALCGCRTVENGRVGPPQKGEALNPMACIEARGLRKAFGTTIALDGIDLRVEEGRILGLIGPNGAGKTTALNSILGLNTYEGVLMVFGHSHWDDRVVLI